MLVTREYDDVVIKGNRVEGASGKTSTVMEGHGQLVVP